MRAARTRGPRSVAIAYLGATAPELLQLRSNDILVVNAGRDALRAHATSPDALQHFLDRGVLVYSSSSLHAKMLATATWAVIGSANASHHSTTVAEAVVISDDSAIVEQVHALVAQLAETETIKIDQVFIDQAHTQWRQGNPVPLVGVVGIASSGGFLPTPVVRMFIEHSHDYEASDAETALQKRVRPTVSRTVPAATYGLQWWRVDSAGSVAAGHPPTRRDGGSSCWLMSSWRKTRCGRSLGETSRPGGQAAGGGHAFAGQ
ncbi:hypothetical protein ABZ420_33545, partial [Nocardia sp. NPDC005745]